MKSSIPKQSVPVVISCRTDEDEDVLGWRLESILPDDWELEIEIEQIPESNEDETLE